MHPNLVNALRARRPQIRAHWETLLRGERANSPLAQPETLVHLIDWSLDEVFVQLGAPPPPRRSGLAQRPHCACGRNPLLVHFIAGEQALLEVLVLIQVAGPALDPLERETALSELRGAVRSLARGEVDAFCSLCQHRDSSPVGTTTEELRRHADVSLTLPSVPGSDGTVFSQPRGCSRSR